MVISWLPPAAIAPLAAARAVRGFAQGHRHAVRAVSRLLERLPRARCAYAETPDGPLAVLRTPWRIPGLAAPEWYVPLIGWTDDRVLTHLDAVMGAATSGRRTRIAALPIEREAIRTTGVITTTIFVRSRRTPQAPASVPGVLIRRSRRADAAVVRAHLELALRRGYRQAEGRDPEPELARRLVDGLVRAAFGRYGISYVAVEEGRVIGHASGQLFDEDDFGESSFAALSDISTGSHGGRGIGNALEEAFAHEAFRRGARFIEGTVIPTDPIRTEELLALVTSRGWRVHRALLQRG